MEFKVEFEKMLEDIYGVSIEYVDAAIDDYYYDKVSSEDIDADKEVCAKIKSYIEQYIHQTGCKLDIKDIQEISDRVLAFAINHSSSDAHYCKFINEYKDKIVRDFIKAEKTLYESEYLIKSGVYEESYDFDLDVSVVNGYVEFKGNLNTLDALVMVCQREYNVDELSEFRDDFGSTYEQRFINGINHLSEFEDIFDAQENIFREIDLSHLYGQCDNYDPDITYEVFENWMGTIEASEVLEF